MSTSSNSSSTDRTVTHWFTVVSALLALALFAVAIAMPAPPWSDLLLGMATSFVFLAVTNVIIRVQTWWSFRRVRRFFGTEMASSELALVYPDFELTPEAVAALAHVGDIWHRPPGVDSTGSPLPEHAFPIEFDRSVAANDVQGLLLFAAAVEQLSEVSASLINDRRVWEDPKRSFCAAGLTSNHCIQLYLITDPHPFFRVDERDGHPIVHLACGVTLIDDAEREFGLIMRFSPDRQRNPQRRWWFVAGLEIAGTPAAAKYVHDYWRVLEARTSSISDFVAIVSLPRGSWRDPRLEYVLERATPDSPFTVAFNSGYLTFDASTTS